MEILFSVKYKLYLSFCKSLSSKLWAINSEILH